MAQELVTRAEFSRLCGVSDRAVTTAARGPLMAACVGSRIDKNHPTAVEYREKQTAPSPQELLPGVDPFFTMAFEACQKSGRWTGSFIMRFFKIGHARATRILAQLQAAGHVPGQAATTVQPVSKARKPPKMTIVPPADDELSAWTNPEELVEIPEDVETLVDLTLRELMRRFGTSTRFGDWLRAIKEIEMVNEKRIKNAENRGRLVSRVLVETGVIDPFNSAHVRLMNDGAKTITAAVLSKHQAGANAAEIEAYVADVIGSFLRPVKSKIIRNLQSVAVS